MKIFDFKNIRDWSTGKVVSFGVIAIVVICALISSIYYISPGYRGTLVTLGNVSKTSFTNGMGFKWPFITSMEKTDIRTQVLTDTAITYTKDIQTATIGFTMTYNVTPEAVPYIYQNIGQDYKSKLIVPYLQDAIKDVVGKWQAQDLVGNRDNARIMILELLKKKINAKYIQNITFQITNLDYSDNFEKAIENKVIAAQKAQEAVNNTKRIEEEANQKVISAKADAEAMGIKAQALEKNQKLVDYEAVQKWDGKLPTYMLGGNATPFINLNK